MALITSAFVTVLILPLYKSYLHKINSTEHNFQGKVIPIGLGFFVLLIEIPLTLIYKEYLNGFFLFSLFVMVIVGTYDDLFGDKKIKGLKGHLFAFFYGKITSGFLKAFFGVVISLFISINIGETLFSKFTHFLLILFMINMLNLVDLRPGRALKVFFVLFIFLGIVSTAFLENRFPFILLGMMLIVFFEDVRAKIMLGDSGANLIGLHLGYWYSLYLSLYLQWIVIVLLLVIHYYAEKKSISRLIEEQEILRKIDLWGRKGTL